MEPEINARLKSAAGLLGYSENQFIVEALKSTLDGAENENNAIPRVVALLRTARDHEKTPSQYGTPTKTFTATSRVGLWWGES